MKTLINKDKVSHIYVRDITETKFVWLPTIPTKYIFFGLVKHDDEWAAGYYECGRYGSFQVYFAEIPKNSVDIDGTLFEKPSMSVYSGGKCIMKKYYETVREVEIACKTYFPNVNVTF